MKFPLSQFFGQWAQLRRFRALDASDRDIVFYAEDASSWVHFAEIVEHLTESLKQPICYLTSSETDPILQSSNKQIRSFWIGEGSIRTAAFMNMRATMMVMTMPSLETYFLKRSRMVPVHYVYLFHSLVSTHMIYVPGAFNHYDTIFCAGTHHNREIRAAEKIYQLKQKELVDVGYGRLDSLLCGTDSSENVIAGEDMGGTRVLIAPSWGPNGLLERHAVSLVKPLLNANYHVTVRPHPMTIKKRPDVIKSLQVEMGNHPRFILEIDIRSSESLHKSHVMISDWSGVALEYAFVRERPVIFVDVPRKVNNPLYEEIDCIPIEVSIRNEIGRVISPDNLASIPNEVEAILQKNTSYTEAILAARERSVYNVGASGKVGAEAILQIRDRLLKAKQLSTRS